MIAGQQDNMHEEDAVDFTEEEIEEQLVLLGYTNIPKHRLAEFKRDLDDLIRRGELKNLISLSQTSSTDPPPSHPPAYIKEKVGPWDRVDGDDGFFLHARDISFDKQAMATCPDRDRVGFDSYARHSVAPKPPPPSGFHQLPQTEEDASESSRSSECCTPSTDNERRRVMKRKVLRKHKGQSLVCDESVYTEDSDPLEEQMARLRLSPQSDSEDESEDGRSRSDSSGAEETSSEAYTCSDVHIRPKLKSFIRPVVERRTMKKTDPVAKYFQYKRLWDVFKLPGEADRTALRMEIKERLAFQPPPPKPRRVYVPNTYVVPTEKKRSALRWEVRTWLARGAVP